jgi:hypothetical protein
MIQPSVSVSSLDHNSTGFAFRLMLYMFCYDFTLYRRLLGMQQFFALIAYQNTACFFYAILCGSVQSSVT